MWQNQIDETERATCKASNFSCCCLIFSARSFCLSSDDTFSFLRTPHGIFCFCSGASHLKTIAELIICAAVKPALVNSANWNGQIWQWQHSPFTCPVCCQGSWDTPNCLDSACPQHPSGMAMFSTLNIYLKIKNTESECRVIFYDDVYSWM